MLLMMIHHSKQRKTRTINHKAIVILKINKNKFLKRKKIRQLLTELQWKRIEKKLVIKCKLRVKRMIKWISLILNELSLMMNAMILFKNH